MKTFLQGFREMMGKSQFCSLGTIHCRRYAE